MPAVIFRVSANPVPDESIRAVKTSRGAAMNPSTRRPLPFPDRLEIQRGTPQNVVPEAITFRANACTSLGSLP